MVMSRSAEVTLACETDWKVADVRALAPVHRLQELQPRHDARAILARHAVAPCSVRTMSEIATGVTSSLLTRAADVVLKERRRLVLMVRETPFHLGHLRTMTQLAEMGAIIAPPLPGLYARPETVDDVIDHSVGRVLDLFGLDTGLVRRWGEHPRTRPGSRPRD